MSGSNDTVAALPLVAPGDTVTLIWLSLIVNADTGAPYPHTASSIDQSCGYGSHGNSVSSPTTSPFTTFNPVDATWSAIAARYRRGSISGTGGASFSTFGLNAGAT